MGFFYRPAGGGAGNDLTVPTGSVTIDADTNTYSVNLVNTGTTPASVELSFQNSRLKGLSPDSGTEASPTYVVDPDAGSRSITLERTPVVTGDTSERVTFTSNQGTTQFLDFIMTPQNLHTHARLLSQINPTFEYKLAGDFVDTGTSATGALTLLNSPSAVSSTSDLAGLVGYADFSVAQQAKVPGSHNLNFLSGQARSILWIGKLQTSSPSTVNHVVGTNATNGPLYLSFASGSFKSANTYVFNYDTTQDHTDGGSSVKMGTTENTEVAILYSHDGGTSLTVRWKTLNGNTERTGHSFKTVTRSGTASTISDQTVFGWNTLLTPWRHRHLSVYDFQFTEANFADFTTILGFGA